MKQKQGYLPIHYAACQNTEILKLLPANGAEVYIAVNQEDSWAHGMTALADVCGEKQGRGESVRILLDASADPNKQLGRQCTPFLFALFASNTNAVSLLLERVADVASLRL